MNPHPVSHVEQSLFSIQLMKGFLLLAFLGLPFSFQLGVGDWRYLIVAPLVGAFWFAALICFWRAESMLAGAGAFLLAVVGHHLADNVYEVEPPFGHFLQWLFLFLLPGVSPLLFISERLIEYCGLRNTGAEQ